MHLTCLIVDDEPNAVNLLEMFIRQNTGWTIPASATTRAKPSPSSKTIAQTSFFSISICLT